MKILLGLRAILTLFFAVLMPLELGHCALMPLKASAIAIESEHHDDGDHDCCPESAPSPKPIPPTDPCCCAFVPLSAATAPTSVSVNAPTSDPAPHALVPMVAAPVNAQGAFGRLEPDAHSGSPPDPSTFPQSPRGPPYSA